MRTPPLRTDETKDELTRSETYLPPSVMSKKTLPRPPSISIMHTT